MKVKLLRKIRKRYSITHYPNGCYFWSDWWDKPITVLWDNENSWRWKASEKPKEDAYKELMEILRNWIEKDYKTSRKRKNVKEEILWYK